MLIVLILLSPRLAYLPNDGECNALISAHIVQLEQTPPSSRYMILPSGIYTIQNVKYRNWAMLFDANEGDVVAGSPPNANVGEKVRTLEMYIQRQSLTNPSSGASLDCQTELILFRINSTAAIMRLTLLLISRKRE
jgi:hypothetical protein